MEVSLAEDEIDGLQAFILVLNQSVIHTFDMIMVALKPTQETLYGRRLKSTSEVHHRTYANPVRVVVLLKALKRSLQNAEGNNPVTPR